MDANGTRFALVLGEADWTTRLIADPAHPETPPPTWDARYQELTLEQQLFRYPGGGPGDPAVGPDDRRGAGFDRFGNIYWIDDASANVLVQDSGTGEQARFWPPQPGPGGYLAPDAFGGCFAPTASRAPIIASARFAALAVTTTQYLVVGTLEPAGLLVFDLQATGPPRQMLWPTDVPFAPFDAAPLPDGGVAILDRVHAALWRLDASFQIVAAGTAPAPTDPVAGGFVPVGGSGATGSASTLSLAGRAIVAADSVALPGDPVSVVAVSDQSLLVLDRRDGVGASWLWQIESSALGRSVALSDSIPTSETSAEQIDVVGQDMTLISAGDTSTLYVADAGGDQAYAFALGGLDDPAQALTATLALRYYPMRLFGGQALIDNGTGAYYLSAGRWVPLVDQCRPRFATDAWLASADGQAFDGREPGCVWHRLFVDARIPDTCSIEVFSRAADEPWMLAGTDWSPEPAPLRRPGPDRPYLYQPDPYGTWELLFQRAQGRWLELKLHLIGDGRSSPHLHSLRASYPRFSYLEHYLPKVYSEDPDSASFLDRFLANVEGLETELEDRIAAAQVLLDPRSAPAEDLDWLASFFDVALDPVWGEARQRVFLANAMEFFRWRGTAHGLRMALRLALDDGACADQDVFAATEDPATSAYQIVEAFRLRGLPAVVAADPLTSTAPAPAAPGTRWRPVDGGGALAVRYGAFLGASGAVTWPLTAPQDATAAAAWQAFTESALGFVPAATDADVSSWQAFLIRRYRTVSALASAYGLPYTDISEVDLPQSLPADGAPLRDWYDFETIVLAMARSAHRFTVLLPVPVGDSPDDSASDQQRSALTERIVTLQKPAHTIFDVRFYWEAFRIGQARLGEGTTVGLGSRSPRLLAPVVLGAGHVGEGYLGGDPPPRLTDPPSLGRRTTASSSEQETT